MLAPLSSNQMPSSSSAVFLGIILLLASILSSAMSLSDDITKRKIHVCTFTPVAHVYSLCPFAIKLESFLRINKIPYEANYIKSMGPKGMVPWVILGDDKETGETLPDSNVIISRIQDELKDEESFSESQLSPSQRATTHMLIRMLEEHLIQIHFYYRYGLHMEEFVKGLEIADRWPPGFAASWVKFQPELTKTKTKYRGLSRHSDEEIWKFSNDDIRSISELLGDQPFLFGDKPSLADCAVFGHLSQFLWIPLEFPQKKFMHEQCPNLVDFMNRFRNRFWPDWKDLCETFVDWPPFQSSRKTT